MRIKGPSHGTETPLTTPSVLCQVSRTDAILHPLALVSSSTGDSARDRHAVRILGLTNRRRLLASGDVVLAFVLCGGAALYVLGLPRFLGSDEGFYLYEAKRLLSGDRFYRDIVDLITPGAHYLMAGFFWLFGTDMATARGVDAAIHGLIVATIFATCRLLGVPRPVAAPLALLHVAIFQPSWQCASPHWLAALLTLALLPPLIAKSHAVVPGILVGLLAVVQQQKSVPMAAGVGAFLMVESLLAGPGCDHHAGRLVRRLAQFGGGICVVVVPAGAALLAAAGVRPLVDALVLHPLVNYHLTYRISWGFRGLYPTHTFPGLFGYLPLLTGLEVLRVLVGLVRGGEPERQRRSALLAAFSAAAVASIAYYPDFIHLSFIGSVFLVLAGDLMVGLLAALARRPRLARGTEAALAAVLALGVSLQLGRVMRRTWEDFPFAFMSPFGRVDFHDRALIELYERVRALPYPGGSREIFGYPWNGALQLATGTINPTPYQVLIPPYSGPEDYKAAIAALERRQVPYVLVFLTMPPGDPMIDYLSRHYEQLEDAGRKLRLYRRRGLKETLQSP